MGYVPKRTGEDTQFVRRLFDFEPLERRLLFDITPIYTLVPISSPVWTGPIIFSPGPIVSISTNGLNGSSPLTILDNRQSFTGVVAKFSDSDATDPSTYSATINWGDGSPTVQGTVVSDPNGGFDVLGSHTYVFGQYMPTITITAPGENPGDDPRTLGITGNLSVFPPPTACEAFPINAVNGQAFRSTIATYTGLDTTQLDRYSASINWGDGNQSPGQLVLNPDGSVSVVGQYLYLNPGFDNVEVTLTANGAAADADAATAFCRATVANGFCVGNISNLSTESGVPYNGNLAFFQFLGPDRDISNLRANIVLLSSDGTWTTVPGTIVPGDNGFYVSANAIFTCDGSEPIDVAVFNSTLAPDPALGADQQLVGLAEGYVSVASHLTFTPQSAAMTAGMESRVLLGHLASDDPDNLWNKSFDVQINWGDGSGTSEGEAVLDSTGGYDIYGTHTYPIIGYANNYSFEIAVTETRTSTNGSAFAGPYTYSVGGGTNYQTGTPNISVAAGSFTGFYIQNTTSSYYSISTEAVVSAKLYLGNDLLGTKAKDIVATVQWSDGLTENAIIIQNAPGQFSIVSARDDLPDGIYTAVLTVTIGSYQKTADFGGNIQPVYNNYNPPPPVDYSLHANIRPVPVNTFVGDHYHGVVATFTVPGTPGQASDYGCYVSIPGASNLTTSVVANSDGSFSIIADFDATSPSDAYSTVSITNGEKYSQTNLSMDLIIDPTRVILTPEYNLEFRQRELFTTTVATFTAPSPTDTPSDFTATIDWGDGDTTTGVITEQYNGTFDISGTSGYVHNSGGMTLKITVTDSTGRSIFTYSSLYLDPNPVSITPGTPTISVGTVSGNLANFEDDYGDSTDPSEYRVYHAALIDWGDGSITDGLITTNPDGTYSVASTHTYQADGDYQIHILVRRNTFYAWQPFQPISFNNGFGDVIADASVAANSSIVADPDSDFGVTFYVHIVGTGIAAPNPPPQNTPFSPLSTASSNSITIPTGALFSNSAILQANSHSESLAISSPTQDSWLASDEPLLDSAQSGDSGSPISSLLQGSSD